MKLIAKWKPELEPAYDEPSSVVWEDGTAATLNDYRTHELDTSVQTVGDDGGTECRMVPEIVVEVTFDPDVKDWVVRGQGVVTFGLELNDPYAKDEQIIAGLYTFPIVYRANITRVTRRSAIGTTKQTAPSRSTRSIHRWPTGCVSFTQPVPIRSPHCKNFSRPSMARS